MIFTDEAERAVVLAIRGTSSLNDAILDLVADAAPFLDGKVKRLETISVFI